VNDKPTSTRNTVGRQYSADEIETTSVRLTRYPKRKINPRAIQSAADQEQIEISRANYVSDVKRAKVTLPKVTIQRKAQSNED
jgi:hypothetical protein